MGEEYKVNIAFTFPQFPMAIAKLPFQGWDGDWSHYHYHYHCHYHFRDGTVTGELQGEQEMVSVMRTWLETTGSPQSRVDRAEFRNTRQINNYSFENFKIIR